MPVALWGPCDGTRWPPRLSSDTRRTRRIGPRRRCGPRRIAGPSPCTKRLITRAPKDDVPSRLASLLLLTEWSPVELTATGNSAPRGLARVWLTSPGVVRWRRPGCDHPDVGIGVPGPGTAEALSSDQRSRLTFVGVATRNPPGPPPGTCTPASVWPFPTAPCPSAGGKPCPRRWIASLGPPMT